jgi:LysR family hydrogen peroxide-inducible transcriptional activator
MNLPSVRQLQYFVAVADSQHFGRAAEHCFVTQSTLSAGVQDLESLLGTPLFERSKRQVSLTPMGARLLEQARQILFLSRELVETAKSDGTPLSGALRLGVIPTIGPFLLPRVLPAIRHRYPQLELFLVEDQSARLIERLSAGDLDAAIIAFPFAMENLERELFWSENFLLALPEGHALAGQAQVSTSQLPREELMLLEEGHCLTDHALAVCHLDGLKSKAAFQGTSLYTLLQMVAGGQGMTFVPQMAVTTELLKSSEIALVALAEPGPHRQIGLVWRKTYHRKADLHLLASHMQALLEGREI